MVSSNNGSILGCYNTFLLIMDQFRHFNVLVVGDNPEELMAKYDSRNKVEKHIVYTFDKADEYHKSKLKVLKGLINSPKVDDDTKKIAQLEYDYYKDMSTIDFYIELTEAYDLDPETGNAYTTDNTDAKFDGYNKNGIFSHPFITKSGLETYSTIKGNVDWEKVHLGDTRTYNVVWETVMEGKEPQDKDEEIVYNNMKNRKAYLENFKDKMDYVYSMASFWCYAYLDENGWVELEGPQFEWVKNFYERFVAPLTDDTKLTIFDCTRV